jgi:hypothetical protein
MSPTLLQVAATPAGSKEPMVIDQAGHMDVLDWEPAIDACRQLLARLEPM